jgi:hypothetical protein
MERSQLSAARIKSSIVTAVGPRSWIRMGPQSSNPFAALLMADGS